MQRDIKEFFSLKMLFPKINVVIKVIDDNQSQPFVSRHALHRKVFPGSDEDSSRRIP